MRILICRRNAALARQTRDALQETGAHRIVGCIGSSQAEAGRLRMSGADAYVLDCAMPYIDGPSLARQLDPLPCVLIAGSLRLVGLPNVHWVERPEEIPDALQAIGEASLPVERVRDIAEELLRLGFKPQTLGARQLQAALETVLRDDAALLDVKGRVYRPIAERMGCTPASVERNIRYAIECAWTSGDLNAIEARFGYTIQAEKGKPTNRAFLAQIAEYIRLHRA
jgi:CheY-like chemotaxis protein